ncbi:MAG: serine/threonine-protein kinase [Sandaracinaceae bacterium]
MVDSPRPALRFAAAGARTASDPRRSEETRALMQARLALLGLVTFGLSAGFGVLHLSILVVTEGPASVVAELVQARRWTHLLGASASLALWLGCRTGTRSADLLLAFDAVATVVAVVPYTLMGLETDGLAGLLMVALTFTLVLVTRALLVPSDALRTFGISGAAAVVSFAIALWTRLATTELGSLTGNLGLWLLVAVANATVASWVLFGLRQQVQEARQLGQYVLGEKIGEGGMGAVYRAQHALLRRPTAVKLLPPEKAGETSMRRFEREVQLTASLSHPNTVTVFDYGHTPDGVFYYAMEYLDGGDLSAVVQATGPMPEERVVHILAQVAAGLAEAHSVGLIHRDIKPGNVLLAGQPAVADLAKLVDFGLVREQDAGSGITQTDTVLGTPLYLAPEGITAPDDVTAAVDVYALGAVGYYLLTGDHVFTGATIVEICSHHLHSVPVPIGERRGSPVNEMLEEVLMSCLAKRPEERPDSAEALRDLLVACAEDLPPWDDKEARRWWAENRDGLSA